MFDDCSWISGLQSCLQRAIAALIGIAVAGCQTAPILAPLALAPTECLTANGGLRKVDCSAANCSDLAYTADLLRLELTWRSEPDRGRPTNWDLETAFAFIYYYPIAIPLSIYALAKEAEDKRANEDTVVADRKRLAELEKLMRDNGCPAVPPIGAGQTDCLTTDVPMLDCRIASCDQLAHTKKVLQRKISEVTGPPSDRAWLAAVERYMLEKDCLASPPNLTQPPSDSGAVPPAPQ
jgi:hypothetical protein